MDWEMVWIRVLSWWESGGWTQAALIFSVGWLSSYVVRWLFQVVVVRLASHTETDLDDKIVEIVRKPVGHTVQILALWLALMGLNPSESVAWGITGVLGTVAIGIWTLAATRITAAIIEYLVEHSDQYTFVNTRTMPVFEFAADAFVYGGAAFLVCEAWEIDTTGWLASAGVIGVAVGFASQETLSNLIAGVFILADAPYKLGDFLELDDGTRGKVIEIGIRTTRLLTLDDVEIIVPNALMASSRITNQSGGPWVKHRVTVDAGVAYGSDIDRVREILLEEAAKVDNVARDPRPHVIFREMADSALVFGVRVWVPEPGMRDAAVDALNTRIYKRLNQEGIEIPYPKHDVYLYPQQPEATP